MPDYSYCASVRLLFFSGPQEPPPPFPSKCPLVSGPDLPLRPSFLVEGGWDWCPTVASFLLFLLLSTTALLPLYVPRFTGQPRVLVLCCCLFSRSQWSKQSSGGCLLILGPTVEWKDSFPETFPSCSCKRLPQDTAALCIMGGRGNITGKCLIILFILCVFVWFAAWTLFYVAERQIIRKGPWRALCVWGSSASERHDSHSRVSLVPSFSQDLVYWVAFVSEEKFFFFLNCPIFALWLNTITILTREWVCRLVCGFEKFLLCAPLFCRVSSHRSSA